MSVISKLSPDQVQQIFELASPELSAKQLADKIGGSYYSVKYYLRTNNLPHRQAGYSNKQFTEQKEGSFNVDELEDWIVGGNRYSKYQQAKQNYGR